MYSVYVYAICKNEAQFAARFMETAREADGVIALDTGSQDGTQELLRSLGAVVHEATFSPWRFDMPRNAALDLVPPDADICVSLDLDEVIEPGWRALLEAAWMPGTDRASYDYIWSFNPDGTPAIRFTQEKIHRRTGVRWKRPVHEVLVFDKPEKTVYIPGLRVSHYADNTKPRSSYLPLLELAAREDVSDDRASFWLGREYYFYRKYREAIAELKRYLTLRAAVWEPERSAAYRYMALSHAAEGDRRAAKRCLWQAIAECGAVREPYYELVKLAFIEEDWEAAYTLSLTALSIPRGRGGYLEMPECADAVFRGYADFAAARQGMKGGGTDV